MPSQVRSKQGCVYLRCQRQPWRTNEGIAAGGFEPETAESATETGVADAVAFGRHFVANPDLPLRIREGLVLTPYDRDTFYTFDSVGYNDYPFVNELASR